MKRDEVVVGLVLFLFGAWTAFLSSNMKLGTLSQIGSGVFPLILGILLMVLSSLYLAQTFLHSRNAGQGNRVSAAPQIAGAGGARISQPTLHVVTFVSAMIFFALFLNVLGYLLCVFLILGVLLRGLGLQNWVAILMIALVSAIGSWLLFAKLLTIPLPQGLVWF